MPTKKRVPIPRGAAPVLKERFGPVPAEVGEDEAVSVHHCALCGSDRGPFEVMFDGRHQLSICAACSAEGEQQ